MLLINTKQDLNRVVVLVSQLLYGYQLLTEKDYQLVIPAYKMADKYGALKVLELCKGYLEYLKTNFNVNNVVEILSMAHEYKWDELKKAAMDYVKA